LKPQRLTFAAYSSKERTRMQSARLNCGALALFAVMCLFALRVGGGERVEAAAAHETQAAPESEHTVSREERTQSIRGVVHTINEWYIFPDKAKRMEKLLNTRASRGEYDSATDGFSLAQQLTTDLQSMSHDLHIRVDYFAQGAPETVPAWQQAPDQLTKLQQAGARQNFGFTKFECLPGNIGYIEIRTFLPPSMAAEAASAAMSSVARSDALIIDLRRNDGGSPAMMAFVESYLFDEPTRLSDVYERVGNKVHQWWTMPAVPGLRFGQTKPVYVLTSRMTFSAAEAVAYDLKNLKRAQLIGETTAGGAHPKRLMKVSEHFAVSVPFARAISPITKTNWEGTGVIPDISVAASESLEVAYRLALEKLVGTATDSGWKEQLQEILNAKRVK
jgi:hypothetical protein